MTPRSSDTSYLSGASKAVYEGMLAGDPNATWLMQGWLFQDTNFWKPPQIKALLQGNKVAIVLFKRECTLNDMNIALTTRRPERQGFQIEHKPLLT